MSLYLANVADVSVFLEWYLALQVPVGTAAKKHRKTQQGDSPWRGRKGRWPRWCLWFEEKTPVLIYPSRLLLLACYSIWNSVKGGLNFPGITQRLLGCCWCCSILATAPSACLAVPDPFLSYGDSLFWTRMDLSYCLLYLSLSLVIKKKQAEKSWDNHIYKGFWSYLHLKALVLPSPVIS